MADVLTDTDIARMENGHPVLSDADISGHEQGESHSAWNRFKDGLNSGLAGLGEIVKHPSLLGPALDTFDPAAPHEQKPLWTEEGRKQVKDLILQYPVIGRLLKGDFAGATGEATPAAAVALAAHSAPAIAQAASNVPGALATVADAATEAAGPVGKGVAAGVKAGVSNIPIVSKAVQKGFAAYREAATQQAIDELPTVKPPAQAVDTTSGQTVKPLPNGEFTAPATPKPAQPPSAERAPLASEPARQAAKLTVDQQLERLRTQLYQKLGITDPAYQFGGKPDEGHFYDEGSGAKAQPAIIKLDLPQALKNNPKAAQAAIKLADLMQRNGAK